MTPAYYLDSSVFLTTLLEDRSASVVEACRGWLDRADSGELDIVISTLTWDEVVYVAGRGAKSGGAGKPSYDHKRAARAGELLVGLPFLRLVEVELIVIHEANRALHDVNIRPRDCVHALMAQRHANGRLVSLDMDFQAMVVSKFGLKLFHIDD